MQTEKECYSCIWSGVSYYSICTNKHSSKYQTTIVNTDTCDEYESYPQDAFENYKNDR